MTIVPAIDIRAGRVVRLRQGQVESESVYGSEPVAAARRWEAEGAARLHIVDLDAAVEGKPQFDAVEAVIDAVAVPVEVGGGLRVLENAMRYRARGLRYNRQYGACAPRTRPTTESARRASPDWRGAPWSVRRHTSMTVATPSAIASRS